MPHEKTTKNSCLFQESSSRNVRSRLQALEHPSLMTILARCLVLRGLSVVLPDLRMGVEHG